MSIKIKKGFQVLDTAEFHLVNVFELDRSIPLEKQDRCPACVVNLEVAVTLVGHGGKQQIRIGFCKLCGYSGYMDRPSKEWMVNFYSNTWDSHIVKTVDEVKALPDLMSDRKSSRRLAVGLIDLLPTDKGRPVCEIGSGYGTAIRYFKEKGFLHVFGTENSAHRAANVSAALGVRVLAGNFEGERVQEELEKEGPFGLLYSHHVFEHVYHPAEVIQAMADLQREGDHVIMALPNISGEHAGYAIFYLPHLHAFSKESLEVLFNRFGYELVADVSPDPSNTIVAFRKTDTPKPLLTKLSDYHRVVIDKFESGLGLKEIDTLPPLLEYRWLVPGKGSDDAQMLPVSHLAWYGKKALMFLKAKLRRHTSAHRFLVKRLYRRYTDAPIEIQYSGNIKFLMK